MIINQCKSIGCYADVVQQTVWSVIEQIIVTLFLSSLTANTQSNRDPDQAYTACLHIAGIDTSTGSRKNVVKF